MDMWVAVVSSLVVLAIIFGLLRVIVFYAFDETSSRVFGVRATLLHYLMLTMIAAMVVLCMKLLGLILVTALLIVPGASALMLSRRFNVVLIGSIAIGEIAMVGGYLAAFGFFDGRFAIGPIVVLMLGVLFAGALATHTIKARSA
jgi:zinc transport system permease protein